jgi:sugar-specific transcriptional regulator TrmB
MKIKVSIIIEPIQVETLKNVGLSLVQARVYLNLVKLGTADIKTIALSANVARQDTYRIMSSLEKMGLVERVIAETTMFTAKPIREGLNRILESKKREYFEAQKQVERVFDHFYEKSNNNNDVQEVDVKFTITSEMNLLFDTHARLSDTATETIDTTLPLNLQKKTVFQHFKYIKRAVKRGIKVRVIAQISEQKPVSALPDLLSIESFQMRHLPVGNNLFGMHIFDQKEMTLAVSESKPLPSLWTNSPHVVRLATVYFENLWKEAIK